MAKRQWRSAPIGKQQPTKLTLAQSLDLGRSLLSQGNLLAAENVLSSILTALPEEPGALHLMGALRNMQGKSDEALTLLEKAVQWVPNDAGRWNDLGLVYAKLMRAEQAMAAFQRSIDLAGPGSSAAKSLDNLGRLQLKCDVKAAEQSFRQATMISPDFGLGWYGLAEALINLGRLDEGLQAVDQAVRLMPKSLARAVVASALTSHKHQQAAVKFYQEWLLQDPDNALVLHHLKALTQPQSPDRASDAYIQMAFDGFAATFDSKLARLDYHAPAQVVAALQACYPVPAAALDVVDAGCGTGLCGPLVASWAKSLCGVDLSAGMLAQAKARSVYSGLYQAELVSFLHAHPDNYDVVISADTLCYFGSLIDALAACHRAVRHGGHVFFTVEALLDDSVAHRLAPTGRYAHSRVHVQEAAQQAGLTVGSMDQATLRTEGAEPVVGWVVSLKKL
jgi:predicted TPR repeat methyltransferase